MPASQKLTENSTNAWLLLKPGNSCAKTRVPELEYIFKHALVQEATYESILLRRRKEIHRQVAATIEALYPDRLEEFYSRLAYHYTRAEEWDRPASTC